MSESKKYYWLKLKEDFFDDDTIQFIEEQENGIIYSNFYLKLCLKSIRTNGKLMRLIGKNLIPYDVKSLAKLTQVPADTVAVAMNLFERMGLVERLETGEIYLAQINELIGTETDKAAIMRRKRAKEKLLGNDVTKIGNNITPMLPERYPEIEIEKDIEIRDRYRDREREEIEDPPDDERPASTAHISVPYEQIKGLYNEICVSFPKCTAMSEARKKAIRARFSSGYTLEDFRRLFEKTEASRFMKGANSRNWRATFDWLIKDGNMAKVLDGNYDDHAPDAPGPGEPPSTGNPFLDMLREEEGHHE